MRQQHDKKREMTIGRQAVALIAAFATVIAGAVTLGGNAAAQGSPASQGEWGPTMAWDIIPIHASLDSSGRVVTWGSTSALVGGTRNHMVTWDPGSNSRSYTQNTLGTNLFSAVSLSDPLGRGTLILGGQTTATRTNSFTAQLQGGSLSNFDELRSERWKGNAVTLADGRILMQGGAPVENSKVDRFNEPNTAEIWEDGVGWTSLTGTASSTLWDGANRQWFYPRAHVMPDGRVWSLAYNTTYLIDPEDDGAIEQIGSFPGASYGASSMSVQYDDGLILQFGGGASDNRDKRRAGSTDAWIVDLNGESPSYSKTDSLSFGRHWGSPVLLPNGNVLAIGGSSTNNEEDGVAYAVEMWDRNTQRWSTLASNTTPRLYHSVGLLMNNGEVFVGGGGAPGPITNNNAETFRPPYLFNSDGSRASQMTISGVPESIEHDTSFEFDVTGTANRVTMIKVTNATHSLNSQIFQELEFEQSGNTITAVAPENPNIATPGMYQLFAIDAAGVPSHAGMVRVEPGEWVNEPTGENLALGRPAKATTTLSADKVPDAAVDGDETDTSWASDPVNNQTFEVDLGTMARIDDLVIRWAENFGERYVVEVSDDAGSWTEIYRSEDGDGDRDIINLDDSVDGRHVRLRGLESGTGAGFEMYEFEVYGIRTPIDRGTNLALRRPVEVSSTSAGLPTLAVDESRATTWVSEANDSQTLEVDLGDIARIDSVNIEWGRRGFGKRYTIEVSETGANWTEIYSESLGNGAGDDLVAAAGRGRYIRLTMQERGTADAYSIEEFEVYGERLDGRGENLALNKTATASSVQEGRDDLYGSTFATDGDETSPWGSSFEDNQWLQIDLGRRARIDEIVIKWASGFGKVYAIQVSDDGETWVEVYRTTDGLGDLDEFDVTASGRHIRLEAVERGTADGFSLFEFEAYGAWFDDDRGLNLALNKPAAASSIEGDDPNLAPNRANDGDASTRWSSVAADNQEWKVDLGRQARIDEIVIEWNVAFRRKYAVDISDDGVNWNTVYTTETETVVNDDFRVDATAQYIRLRGLERADGWGFSVYEFEAYGEWIDPDDGPPRECDNDGGVGDDDDTNWWCNPDDGPPPSGPWIIDLQSPEDLRDEITARLNTPSIDIGTSPDFESLAVELETWFWIVRGWETSTSSATTPDGVFVEIRVIPAYATWDFGDGTTLRCDDEGTEWTGPGATTDCSHTFSSSSAGLPDDVYKGSVTITREHHSWHDGVYQGIDRTSDLIRHFDLPVGEIQVIELGD